jgi:hypothetical protein
VTNRVFVNGKVHVRRTMCATCIFRPGNLMGLSDGRVEEMIRDADEAGSCIPCHTHLYTGSPIEPVCRGYYDRRSSVTLRLADAAGVTVFTNVDESV